MHTKLFIANLPWSLTEAELRHLFEESGEVLSVRIPTRREDGKSRGFGFIEMGSPEQAQQAIQAFNGRELNGRALVVTPQTREDTPRAQSSSRY
jgi:RNA recognition motif-containing protein